MFQKLGAFSTLQGFPDKTVKETVMVESGPAEEKEFQGIKKEITNEHIEIAENVDGKLQNGAVVDLPVSPSQVFTCF